MLLNSNNLPALLALCAIGLTGVPVSGASAARSVVTAQNPAAAAAPAPVAPDPAAVQGFNDALDALRAGDEGKATEMLRDLTARFPAYAGPWTNLALVHMRHDELGPALELLQRAAAVCTHCAPVHNLIGVVERRQGDFTAAERSYQTAISADGGCSAAHFNLAILYELFLRRPDQAAGEYARYVELAADPLDSGEVNKWIADLKRRSDGAAAKTEVAQ